MEAFDLTRPWPILDAKGRIGRIYMNQDDLILLYILNIKAVGLMVIEKFFMFSHYKSMGTFHPREVEQLDWQDLCRRPLGGHHGFREEIIFEVIPIIISLRELYVAIEIRAPIQSTKKTYAAFPPLYLMMLYMI